MRTFLQHAKTHNPASLSGGQWTGTQFADAFKRNRAPTPNELLAELKNTAFTCASINAATCATYAPRLFVWSDERTPRPKCRTRELDSETQKQLLGKRHIPRKVRQSVRIDEVLAHPMLELFEKCNPVHNGFDLWELTTFYQETVGAAYWYVEADNLGVPAAIWILPAQNMAPKRDPRSNNLVDYYEYKVGAQAHRYDPKDIVHFRYPDPKDPYTAGLSPLRACWEQASLSSEYLAFKKSTWENSAIPGVVVSPDEVIGEEERDRLEQQWNAKFRRGGQGRALISESGMKISILQHSIGDLAALAEYGATKEDICNAFHVPLSYLTKDTNLANLEAAEQQHLSLAIQPRLWRRDQKLNECLVPYYDKTGRLFLVSDDPLGIDIDNDPTWFDMNMKHGVNTINEVRRSRGLQPVDWGHVPWLPLALAPTDFPPQNKIPDGAARADYARTTGRNRKPHDVISSRDADAEQAEQEEDDRQ